MIKDKRKVRSILISDTALQKQPSPGRVAGVGGGKRGSVGVDGFEVDACSDDGSEASSISSVGIGNNHLNNRSALPGWHWKFYYYQMAQFAEAGVNVSE